MKITIEIEGNENKVEVGEKVSPVPDEWIPLTSVSQLPRNESFLIWDPNATSGISVYEAMVFEDGSLGCPATTEDFNINEFSHWRQIVRPK